MTMEEAFEILIDYGFTYDKTINEIYYEGERVGYYAGNCLWLCDFQPSLIGFSYLQVHKTIINCVSINAELRLREQIANLLDTPRRYEEFCRKKRLENIKKYFEDRAIVKKWSVFL